ncbi:hypothetical protein OG930_17735 [Streptomyces sp. NBC_01799]|uniref:hypothetical protein n=1 Tax=Streptomyces sp. NBC_01800 TaxID=2975945 RepID=UPI002DDA9EF7|nr:hypothetical protein [Streptomyces sp. NBC_01800]WSA68679.1 hypothetical protein OIE65_17770 [Streptomyces sp. NBC_01800]WSA77293.1 hypothetical protein OG930_17735 [Streptomyces sp. NBC_01799]
MNLVPSAGRACAALALGVVILPATPAQADPSRPSAAIACTVKALKNAIKAANDAGGGTIRSSPWLPITRLTSRAVLRPADGWSVGGARGVEPDVKRLRRSPALMAPMAQPR